MKKIKKTSLDRFTGVMHASLNNQVYEAITSDEDLIREIDIPASILERWHGWIELEEDLCNETRGSILTDDMDEIEFKRTSLISDLFGRIKTLYKYTDQAKHRPAAQLMLIVNAYKKLQRKGKAEKRQLVKGLVRDLQKAENADCITALHLENMVSELMTLNASYDALYAQRVAFYAQRRKWNLEKVRPKTDDCFARVCISIEHAMVKAEEDVTKAALVYALDEWMLCINEIITQMIILRKQSESAKNGAGSGTGDSSNEVNPSEPGSLPEGNDWPSDDFPTSEDDMDDDEEGNNDGNEDAGSGSVPTDEGDSGTTPSGDQGGSTPPDTGGFMG